MSLETFLYLVPFLLVSLVLHELAHAYVATWLGDPSPRADGRLSLNPIVHLDPLGTAGDRARVLPGGKRLGGRAVVDERGSAGH